MLRSFALVLAIVTASPAAADPIDRWRALIAEAGARFDVPATWIERSMRAESGGQTSLNGRQIVSRAGAMGLMQLMPATWTEMRVAYRLGADPHDPQDNIIAGTAYLRAMYDRFGYPGLFAAYNAGPGRYAAHLATGRALPGETRAYVAALTRADRVGQDPPPPRAAVRSAERLAEGPPERTERSAPTLFFPLAAPRPTAFAGGNEQKRGLFVTLSRR